MDISLLIGRQDTTTSDAPTRRFSDHTLDIYANIANEFTAADWAALAGTQRASANDICRALHTAGLIKPVGRPKRGARIIYQKVRQ